MGRNPGMDPSKRWIYILLGAAINLILGSILAFSVMRGPLEELWGISATESGLPYLVFIVMWSFTMPIGGIVLEKLGPRKTAILGSILVGAGWILASFSGNIYVLTLLYGVLGGLGVGFAYGVPIAVAAKWFPEKRGLAIGAVLLGFGLSALIVAPIMTHLALTVGPLLTFRYLGTVFLVILLLLSMPLRFPPEEFTYKAGSHSQSKAGSHSQRGNPQIDYAPSQMLRTRSFYALWIAYVIGTSAGLMAVGIAAPFGREVAKIDPATAGLCVAFFAIFNGLGRFIFGWLTDKFGPRKAGVLSYSMIILASLALLLFGEGNVPLYIVGFSILWLNFGSWLAIAPATTASFFGMKFYARNYGILFTAYGTGALIGTFSSGIIRDITGSYLPSFYLVALLAALGIMIVLLFLKKPGTQ